MSVTPVNTVASALTQLQQSKLSAAIAAKHHLAAHPTGTTSSTTGSQPTAAASESKSAQLPQDTVTLSTKAQKAAPSVDVDQDGDAH